MDNCVFCKIVKGELPAEFLYKDDDIVAFKDIKPSAPVHILIIPTKHLTNLMDANEDDREVLGKIQLIAQKIAREQKTENGFKLITNNGPKAGQIVMHLHYHLMGGY